MTQRLPPGLYERVITRALTEALRSLDPQTQPVEREPLDTLSASDLLVNARGEPGVGHVLAAEIPPSTCPMVYK